MPVHRQGHQHVVGQGQGIGLEKLEYLAEQKASKPFPVKYFPDELACRQIYGMLLNSELYIDDTCHGEHGDHDICQGDVEEDGLAPLLAQAVLAQHEVVQHKAVANHREDD